MRQESDKEGAAMAGEAAGDDIILVKSGISVAGQPLVRIEFRGQGATVSSETAASVGGDLLRAAAAAEADAMLLRFFRGNNFPDGAWEAMVVQWREFQQKAGKKP